MFPLVHYYINKQVFGRVSPLCALGGLWPDLAAAAGGDRDAAHYQGAEFYAWCCQHLPQAKDAALGVIAHGVEPACVDYYADEYWPDHVRGYMFRQALGYLPQVAACTGLEGETSLPPLPRGGEPPRNNVWWKAHNCVEIAYEILTSQAQPQLAAELLAALAHTEAVELLAQALQGWQGLEPRRVRQVFAQAPESYALPDAGAACQAAKQALVMKHRFSKFQVDQPALAALLEQIARDEADSYASFISLLTEKTAAQLRAFA